MTEVHERTITDYARDVVASRFAPREHGAKIAAIGMFALSGLAIATTAGRIDPATAIFEAGLAAGIAGCVMVVSWGAAGGHGDVTMCTAAEIEQRGQEVEANVKQMRKHLSAQFAEILTRLDGIEAVQRETANSVRSRNQDELTRRRSQS